MMLLQMFQGLVHGDMFGEENRLLQATVQIEAGFTEVHHQIFQTYNATKILQVAIHHRIIAVGCVVNDVLHFLRVHLQVQGHHIGAISHEMIYRLVAHHHGPFHDVLLHLGHFAVLGSFLYDRLDFFFGHALRLFVQMEDAHQPVGIDRQEPHKRFG